jgi:hypothetical protein
MAPEEIRSALKRQPFVPLRFTLTEGSTYEVRHPELCMVGRHIAIFGVFQRDDADALFDHSATVDLAHIVKLEPIESSRAHSAN